MTAYDRVKVGEYLNLTYTKDDGTVVKQDRIRISSVAVWRDGVTVRLEHSHSLALDPEPEPLTGSEPTD